MKRITCRFCNHAKSVKKDPLGNWLCLQAKKYCNLETTACSNLEVNGSFYCPMVQACVSYSGCINRSMQKRSKLCNKYCDWRPVIKKLLELYNKMKEPVPIVHIPRRRRCT